MPQVKPPAERMVQVAVRMTLKDKKDIQRQAAAHKMSFSEYVRSRATFGALQDRWAKLQKEIKEL